LDDTDFVAFGFDDFRGCLCCLLDLAACLSCLNFANTGEDLRVVDEARVLGVFPFLSDAGCLDDLVEAEEGLFLDDVGHTAGLFDVFAKREGVFNDLDILDFFRDCAFAFVTESGRKIFDLRLAFVFDKLWRLEVFDDP